MKIYQIDAFAEKLFQGNPAAVCPLEAWLPGETLQAIAEENNLSETVYFVKNEGRFHIRWFTPKFEVDLCGHATLAAAWVIFNESGYAKDRILFDSLSGELSVEKNGEDLVLDFPQTPYNDIDIPQGIEEILKLEIKEAITGGGDCFLVTEDEAGLRNLNPDFSALSKFEFRGICITSTSREFDFISRFFAPRFGINEDPVTGSAHTVLAPYWAKIKGEDTLIAQQASKRSGVIQCTLKNGRVKLQGSAVKFLEGEIIL